MRVKTLFVLAMGLFATLGFNLPTLAQEGHPMTGSWVGDWSTGSGPKNRVVVILDWTGEELVGTINPGPNAIPIQTATVDPADWSLHVEAQGEDVRGRSVTYTFEGALDDLGSYNRSIIGTWTVNGEAGEFSITRQ